MKIPYSKKEMLRDNEKMVRQLKWCQRVIDDLTIRNIELVRELEKYESNDKKELPSGDAK